MKSNNEIEEPTLQSAVPQSNSTETEPNSVSSTNDNYTTQTNKSQIEKDTDIENLSFPIDNTERTIVFEGNYPSKEELQELIELCNIIRLNGKLHICKDNIYTADTKALGSIIFKACSKANHTIVNHIIKEIELAVDNETKESPATLVGFNDCILDTEDLKSKEFNAADVVLTSKLAINYIDQNAISHIDKRLKVVKIFFTKITCGNKKLELLLYIIIGMACCRGNAFKTAFVLAGNTYNTEDGRSEFIELLDRILGNSVSHENLRKLADVKSSLELYGKTCNVSEEVEHPHISYMDNIRKLILGKELKASDTFKFSPYTTLLINVKEILDFGTALFGLKEYFKIIPFNAKRPIKKKILDVLFETETLQYIALQGIKAYCVYARIGKLPVVDVVEQATAKYFRDNNSVLEYCTEEPINGIVCKSHYYYNYCRFCITNNSKRVSRATFGTEIRKLGYEPIRPSFKGKRIQCYIEKGFDIDKCRQDYIQSLAEKNITIEDKDIPYDKLIDFINGYDSEENLDNGTDILGFEDTQGFDFDLST